ncbi:hypothetical protein K400107F7_00680 [Agathobaculum massiliense]
MNTQIPTVKTWKYNPGSSKSKIKIIVAIMTDPCYNAASKNIKKLFLMPSEKGSRTGTGVRMRVHHVCRCGVHG